jgi:hypothetical protein
MEQDLKHIRRALFWFPLMESKKEHKNLGVFFLYKLVDHYTE